MKMILGIVIGAAVGFAIGFFGKCASGMCSLTSNPWVSAIVGALFGALLTAGK
jgi:hypothetical protein